MVSREKIRITLVGEWLMDYDNEQAGNNFSKSPFYGTALFVFLLIVLFAAFSLQENGTLGHWEIATCLLGSGLIAIFIFLPHFLQGVLDKMEDSSKQQDPELAGKAYFELKETRTELDALAVKIDKVPTLVEKIVSEARQKDSDSSPESMTDQLKEVLSQIHSKLDRIEEANSASPLIPEPDPQIEKVNRNVQRIGSDLDRILKRLESLEQVPTLQAHDPSLSESENMDTVEDKSPPAKDLIDEAIAEIEEQTKEIPLSEEPTVEEEEYIDTEEDSSEEVIEGSEKENTEPDPSDIDDESLQEMKDTAPIILTEEESLLPSGVVNEEILESEIGKDVPSDELDLGLPDPAETLRKVDALLAGEDTQTSIEKKDSTTEKTEKNGTTTVVANVMIGIGNKPYLRGDGPGLSWDEGVSMNFVEIGKWAWSPPRKNASLTVQVYRNDQDPDNGGKVEVRPGQKLEITPDFS